MIAGLDDANHAVAVEIASIPDAIRGYGHIKLASLETAKRREAELLAVFRTPGATRTAAESTDRKSGVAGKEVARRVQVGGSPNTKKKTQTNPHNNKQNH